MDSQFSEIQDEIPNPLSLEIKRLNSELAQAKQNVLTLTERIGVLKDENYQMKVCSTEIGREVEKTIYAIEDAVRTSNNIAEQGHSVPVRLGLMEVWSEKLKMSAERLFDVDLTQLDSGEDNQDVDEPQIKPTQVATGYIQHVPIKSQTLNTKFSAIINQSPEYYRDPADINVEEMAAEFLTSPSGKGTSLRSKSSKPNKQQDDGSDTEDPDLPSPSASKSKAIAKPKKTKKTKPPAKPKAETTTSTTPKTSKKKAKSEVATESNTPKPEFNETGLVTPVTGKRKAFKNAETKTSEDMKTLIETKKEQKRKRIPGEEESPTSQHKKPTGKTIAKVLLTGCPDLTKAKEAALNKLGIQIVELNDHFTHVVTPKIARTKKFLCALPKAPIFVHWDWILACLEEKELVDVQNYPLEAEGLKFGIIEARADRLKGCLFSGLIMIISKGVEKDVGDISLLVDIVKANGGQCFPIGKKGIEYGEEDHVLLIANKEEETAISKFTFNEKRNGRMDSEVFDKEWLMNCALTQSLEKK